MNDAETRAEFKQMIGLGDKVRKFCSCAYSKLGW